ncbi:hypothetical protein BH11ACT4_BH11ACT4_20310 [soil metagenome]
MWDRGPMDYFIAVCGFLGAWLLVAGPLLQASLELTEQEIDREKFDEVVSSLPRPIRISGWWWLLPPVAYYLTIRRNSDHQKAVMAALPPEQREQSLTFFNKATGWLIVAGGALLLASKETWEFVEQFEWPTWLFWVLVVVVFALCVTNAAVRMNVTNKALGVEKAPPRRSPRA